MRVLRLCSVYAPRPEDIADGSFDPVGGMQNHTGNLTRCLDELGLTQIVVTSRMGGAAGRQRVGRSALVVRVGVRIRRLRQLWALAALPIVLARRARGPDLVHAHQGEDVATLVLADLASRVHRCPLVVTVHASVRHTLRGRTPRAVFLRAVGGLVERLVLPRAAAVIVMSRRTERMLVADGVPGARIHLIPSGFDPVLFTGPFEDPLPGVGRPRVGFVGRLASSKRPDLVVRAFERLGSAADLVVVGDGTERERLERLVAASPARRRIHVHRFVPHDRVPAWLAHLDVLVMPSDYEERGSILVEALASGLPVVATRVGGIPEAVADGETGLLVARGDVDALAGAVRTLLEDDALRQRFAERSRAQSADFAWPRLARRVADVYEAVVRG
jgi:glycosyltransferase involved in cell wall biosynthesis